MGSEAREITSLPFAEPSGFLIRTAQFEPPAWQVWDAKGEILFAAFQTRDLLMAALPSLNEALTRQGGSDGE